MFLKTVFNDYSYNMHISLAYVMSYCIFVDLVVFPFVLFHYWAKPPQKIVVYNFTKNKTKQKTKKQTICCLMKIFCQYLHTLTLTHIYALNAQTHRDAFTHICIHKQCIYRLIHTHTHTHTNICIHNTHRHTDTFTLNKDNTHTEKYAQWKHIHICIHIAHTCTRTHTQSSQ